MRGMQPGGSRKTWIAQKGAALSGERSGLDGVHGEPPAPDSWRYRTTGFALVLAWFGAAVGFALLIVPGLVATRSVRRWTDGITSVPTFAWTLAVLGPSAVLIWAGLAFTPYVGGVVILAVLVVPAALVWVLRS
jgi:hypothetical protein